MITRTRLSALATTAALVASGGLLTATPAAAAVTCNSPLWKADYYANTTLTGTPKLTTCDSVISENYGLGDPAVTTLPKDNFGVRWTLTRDFGSGGPFAFTAEAQDGIRVSLDGVRKIDLWKNVSTTQKKTLNLTIPAGRHTITVHYATWTGAANVKFGYAPITSATTDKVRPLTPAGFTTAYDKTLNKVTTRWTANKEMDLAGYRVYRRLVGTTAWSRVGGTTTPLTTTTFTNSPPPTGQGYAYEIRAVDKAGNESVGTVDLPVTSVDRTAPGAPTGLKAERASTGDAVLTWTAPSATDVAAYRVYVDGVLTDTVTDTRYVHPWGDYGTTYHFTVRAVDRAGNASAAAATSFTTSGDRVAPAPVTGLKATPREDGVFLEWTPNSEPDVKYYRVYKAEWYDNGEGETGWIAYKLGEYLGPEDSSYLHESTPDGENVLYGVVAVDTWNNEMDAMDPAMNWVEVTELGTPEAG
ncbi:MULTISPECIES: fibronectin type III domain-containing protein [Streptomyces]|uniref:fibronectin type III domain-containing protein n=1 Tax=Streptomyces TaxID=1883 RepID=UPI0004B22BAF|nr:PA14 domain-containing protein [Streptomyces exfoliatus]